MPVSIDFDALIHDPQVEGIVRILAAGLVAALIGLERELAGKPAGIRTYGLVGMGSAMFTVVAVLGLGSPDYASRVIGSIISGIGFLGAGTILHTRLNVVGLTTAAGMWVAAAVGMAMGLGMYLIGAVAGVLLFLLLQFAGPEQYIRSRRARKLGRDPGSGDAELDDAELDDAEEAELDLERKAQPRAGIAWALAPTEPEPSGNRRAAPAPPISDVPWSTAPSKDSPERR